MVQVQVLRQIRMLNRRKYHEPIIKCLYMCIDYVRLSCRGEWPQLKRGICVDPQRVLSTRAFKYRRQWCSTKLFTATVANFIIIYLFIILKS